MKRYSTLTGQKRAMTSVVVLLALTVSLTLSADENKAPYFRVDSASH
jgi:hypothetical protein